MVLGLGFCTNSCWGFCWFGDWSIDDDDDDDDDVVELWLLQV
jgi:hypothetical protein